MDLGDRTPGTRVRGEHWSAARIKTTAIETCIPLSLRWCRQVSWRRSRYAGSNPLMSCRWLSPFTTRDGLRCYKPQGRAGGTEAQVQHSLWPWLVLSPSNEKDSRSQGPAWVSCLGTDARYLSICCCTTHSACMCALCLSHQSTLHVVGIVREP